LDSVKSYSALVYGTSAGVAIWISSIVVSELDSVPLVCELTPFVILFWPLVVDIALSISGITYN
jgi:hypothetical protein